MGEPYRFLGRERFALSLRSGGTLDVPRSAAAMPACLFGLTAAYVALSGTAWSDLVGDDPFPAVGVGVGVVAGALAIPLVRRLPAKPHAHGRVFGETLAWEAVVYGVAEALLLATLPVLAVWHAAVGLGWTGTRSADLATGAAAVLASLVVILVHHLGYAEFRSPRARPKLVGALVTYGVQAIAFLVTGNAIAPIVAHVVLHTEMLLRGIGLPPVPRDAPDGIGSAALGAR